MINFFHQLLNPHCPECKLEKQDSRICNSCETLKMEIERLRFENERLLTRILKEPERVETDTKPISLNPPKNIPWAVRRQMLEAEDRKKAQLLKNAPKPSDNIKDLENELGIVESERNNNATGTSN